MRICLLGSSPNGKLDEGMKNYAHHLFRGLTDGNNVVVVDPRTARSTRFWREIKSFQPEIVHYTSGPSLISLLTLKFIRLQMPVKTIASATHPWFPAGTGSLIRFLAPDLILAPSIRTHTFFSEHGCIVKDILIGVEIGKFAPVSQALKMEFRQHYNLPVEKYIILHVGHIRKKRGIEALANLQVGDQQVLIIGSMSSANEAKTQSVLEGAGCRVIRQSIQHIENFYALSDCYAFPTSDQLSAIEIPLSVLEAMASNLPVIAYPFGGLPDQFQTGEGLVFEENLERWPQRLQAIRRDAVKVNTRSKVLHLDWPLIIQQHETFYNSLLTG